jgi:uncharacterized protein with GYD domain
VAVVSKPVDKLGGTVQYSWMWFGQFDTALVVEMADNVSAAAFAIAIAAGGACKSVKTTPLLGLEDGVAAMKKAARAGYQPPK